MRLQVVGCGDAFGSGGRNHACFLLEGDAGRLLLDCGPGSVPAMKRLGIRPASLDSVLVTHLHGDHFGGVPFLFLDHRYQEPREDLLYLAGPPGLDSATADLSRALYSSGLAGPDGVPTRFLELRPGEPMEVGGARVSPFSVPHAPGMTCLGLRVEMNGKTVVYSGDTEWFDGLVDASRGADLMLLECTHLEPDAGHHISLRDVLRDHHRLQCKQLLLVHLGAAVLDVRHRHDLPWAEDGQVIEL
jgi:ribonuclease BN (tRNA processing enzyme)